MATAQEDHHGDRSGRDDRSGRRQQDEFEALLAEVLVEYELAGSNPLRVLEMLRHASGRLCGKKQLQVSTGVTGASRTNCHGLSMLVM